MEKINIEGLPTNAGDLANKLSRQELLELVEMTSSWRDISETKFHLYTPAPMGQKFHESIAKTRAMFGGNRSSKSYTHIVDYGAQFIGLEPKTIVGTMPKHRLDRTRRLRICMGDYPNSFVKVIWPLVKLLIPEEYIADVVKDSGRIKAIVNKYGGFIEFMQYDQDVTKFQGSSRHSIGYDEEPPQDIRDENKMRLVDTDGEETFSLTPVSGALKYLYDKVFLKRGREVEQEWDFVLNKKGKLIDAVRGNLRDISFPDGDGDIDCFFACIFDNPAINKGAAIRLLSTFPKEEMIVRGKGHFLFLAGLVYKEYSESKHLIDSFDDWWRGDASSDYSLYVFIDPHPRTPHAVSFYVVRRDGWMAQVDELFVDCTAEELVEHIQATCRGKRPEVIAVDPLAASPDPGTKIRLIDRLVDFGLNDPMPIMASKQKSHGIMMTRQALECGEDETPAIQFTRNCEKTRSEIGRYTWDDWRKHDQNTKGEKQKPVDKDDHFMENLYRFILLQPNHVSLEEEYDRAREARPTRGVGRNPMTGY